MDHVPVQSTHHTPLTRRQLGASSSTTASAIRRSSFRWPGPTLIALMTLNVEAPNRSSISTFFARQDPGCTRTASHHRTLRTHSDVVSKPPPAIYPVLSHSLLLGRIGRGQLRPQWPPPAAIMHAHSLRLRPRQTKPRTGLQQTSNPAHGLLRNRWPQPHASPSRTTKAFIARIRPTKRSSHRSEATIQVQARRVSASIASSQSRILFIIARSTPTRENSPGAGECNCQRHRCRRPFAVRSHLSQATRSCTYEVWPAHPLQSC